MAQKKEPVEIIAKLEVLDDVQADDVERHEVLTPEETARRQAEKAQLLASLRGAIPDRPVPDAPPSVGEEPVIIETSPALVAATAAVESADADILALEQEQKALDREHAEAKKVTEAAHKAKLDELRQRRNTAEAEAKRQRHLQAGVELAARVRVQEAEAVRERERQQASADEQKAALAARVQPLLGRAKAMQVELTALNQRYRPMLEKLVRLTWQDTPSAWPNELRVEWNNVIPSAAESLLRALSLQSCMTWIPAGEKIVDGIVTDGQQIEETVHYLGYLNGDLIRVIREQIADLNARLASIHERGEVVCPGQEPLLPSVVADENRALGISGKERAIWALGIRPGEAVESRLLGEDDLGPRRKQTHAETGDIRRSI
jgi:hypothetical protein